MVPLTERGRRNLLIALTITIAATRFYARSRSMWDWDEALFAFAIRDFNVALHHPHPPGFPLFIALAKFMHLFVPDAFNDDRDRWRWIARAIEQIGPIFVPSTLMEIAGAASAWSGAIASSGNTSSSAAEKCTR